MPSSRPCPGSGAYAVIVNRIADLRAAECQACGRRVQVLKSGRLRVHKTATAWQPTLYDQEAEA